MTIEIKFINTFLNHISIINIENEPDKNLNIHFCECNGVKSIELMNNVDQNGIILKKALSDELATTYYDKCEFYINNELFAQGRIDWDKVNYGLCGSYLHSDYLKEILSFDLI